MTLFGDESNASETTGLLNLPSPHSGDGPVPKYSDKIDTPLTSSYEDVQKQMQQALAEESKSVNNGSGWKMKRGAAVVLLVCACLLSVAIATLVYFHVQGGKTAIPSNSGSVPKGSDPMPFSKKHPVRDLGLIGFSRPPETSPPEGLFRQMSNSTSEAKSFSLPTNAWYQNLLLLWGEPSNLHRAYVLPYVVDFVGPIQGLSIHPNYLVASDRVVQLTFNEVCGLTLGAIGDVNKKKEKISHKYSIGKTTELGITLHWDTLGMATSVTRGMAYGTMVYEERMKKGDDAKTAYPTIASPLPFQPPLADGKREIKCGAKSEKVLVEKEVELYFGESDYTWLVFFSEPVYVKCQVQEDGDGSFLQVVDYVDDDESNNKPFVIRAALLDSCTKGTNPNECGKRLSKSAKKTYGEVLRRHADYYPGQDTFMSYEIDDNAMHGRITLDWDMQCMSASCDEDAHTSLRVDEVSSNPSLVTFALPHHLERMDTSVFPENERICKTTVSGSACLIEGPTLSIVEKLPTVSLRAPRPLKAKFIPLVAKTLKKDIKYSLPNYFERGAGDTYFSGKMLSKLGRILTVAEEVLELCDKSRFTAFGPYCRNSTLPTKKQMTAAIDRLQSGVEIWLNGTAETAFVFDEAWGGLVSCGCQWNGDGCDNRAPDCPAFYDQGLNFGNGFYNDQHFHYGYHIYAAAILSHFRPDWAKKYYEEVLLLVRSIANPSRRDDAFPLFRHKDWYQGSSWASGIPLPPYLNGKNQESSSEAIAAYESVALYGQIMNKIWTSAGEKEKAKASLEVKKVGQLMTATELRSTKTYWHVMQSIDASATIYPKVYTANVVGILWQTMVQFGTWFGASPYLPYGIQLLPLTPISEERDNLEWINQMYASFSNSCASNFQCTDSGWVVLQLAVLATVGYSDEAAKRCHELPDDSFSNAGGNGHSRTNTLWYIGTRPEVDKPVPLAESDVRGDQEKRPAPVFEVKDCHTPNTCTDEVLDRMAGNFTCRERMSWFIHANGKSQWGACSAVAISEFPETCGLCDPTLGSVDQQDNSNTTDSNEEYIRSVCPPCSKEECDSDLNRCPIYERTFVCKEGSNAGGCSGLPWDDHLQCDSCCEMTACQTLRDNEAGKVTKDAPPLSKPVCPPCPKSVCYGELNQCPLHTAPYLCLAGHSLGGCSARPWEIAESNPCTECCEVTVSC